MTREEIRAVYTLGIMPKRSASESSLTSYLPFRLYSESKLGAALPDLARRYSLPLAYAEERLEAARLCFEQQIRVEYVPVENAA